MNPALLSQSPSPDSKNVNSTESPRLSLLGESLAGGFAGAFARGAVSPLDVLKIRYQLQRTAEGVARPHYGSLLSATRTIVREEGLRALWRGNGAAMLLWLSYMAVQFPAYRAASDAATRSLRTHELSGSGARAAAVAASLLGGGIAGAAATAVTYPLDWARTRLASQGG